MPTPVPDSVSTLLVDLDGTLVDTTFVHTMAWSLAFDDAGAPHQPMWLVHPLVGTGGDELVTRLVGEPSDEVVAAHARRFAEHLPGVRVLPGADDLLARVTATGRRVCIVTSSGDEVADALVALLGGTGAVDDVVHGGMVATPGPDGSLIGLALERAGVPPTSALALGDSVWDVASASGAGVSCLGIESGGTARVDLYRAGAVDVFRDVRALVDTWDAFGPGTAGAT